MFAYRFIHSCFSSILRNFAITFISLLSHSLSLSCKCFSKTLNYPNMCPNMWVSLVSKLARLQQLKSAKFYLTEICKIFLQFWNFFFYQMSRNFNRYNFEFLISCLEQLWMPANSKHDLEVWQAFYMICSHVHPLLYKLYKLYNLLFFSAQNSFNLTVSVY